MDLVRFRADPRKVRVRIRRLEGNNWVALICRVDRCPTYVGRATGPRKALARALRAAR